MLSNFDLQSEKKYNSKAAVEYRKHLAKLLQGETADSLRSRSKSDDATVDPKGLDGLLSALSIANPSSTAPTAACAPAPETVFRVTPSATPTPKGTLNISAAVSTDNLASTGAASGNPTPPPSGADTSIAANDNTPVSDEAAAAAGANADAMKLLKLGAKKPPAKKAGMGAKKIVTSTPADVRIESFESVEKRSTVAAQEAEDRKLAQALQAQENASSGRVAAMMAESEGTSKTSLYRSTSNNASTSSLSSTNASASGGGSGRYSAAAPSAYRSSTGRTSGTTTASSKGPESHIARDKYSGVKGISSDQFFGRDQEEEALARSRLGQFQGSSGISSDMVYGRAREDSEDGDGSATLQKLKESVAGFFENF